MCLWMKSGGGRCQYRELTVWMKGCGRRREGGSKLGMVGCVPSLSRHETPVGREVGDRKQRGFFLGVPDSGRRTPVWPSCTSCSTLRPRRLAREEPPRCCCMRQAAVQDTGDRKKEKNRPKWMSEEADVPPRLGSLWESLACPVWSLWMPLRMCNLS